MRPRFIINIGVAKTIKAIGEVFELDAEYEASIYYNTDDDVIISATAVCTEMDDGKHLLTFNFTKDQTATLHPGVVSIDIYKTDLNRMVFRDTFAYVRPNSLQITPSEDEE